MRFPAPPASARTSSFKVSKRRELDISAVAAGCYIELDDAGLVTVARFGFGGMAATPARARAWKRRCSGATWSRETVLEASARIDDDFKPIDDARASAWYRGTLAKNLLLGFYLETLGTPAPKLSPRPSGTVHLEVTR